MNPALRVERMREALTGPHWAWAVGLALAIACVVPLFSYDVNNYWFAKRVLHHAPWYLLFAHFFLVAIAWVESAERELGTSPWRYAVAACAAGLLCVTIAASLSLHIPTAPRRVEDGRVVPPPRGATWDVRHRVEVAHSPGLDGALFGFLATMIYARLRNARRMARSLSDAEIGRAEANRALLAARLAAARARIDPREVIAKLDEIARTYEVDPRLADSQLDELIATLRNAIPRLRTDSAVAAGSV